MSVSIPSSFDFGIDLGVDLDITGIPTSYNITTDVKPLTLALNLSPIEVRPIELKPIDFSLRIKEIPAIRAHLPLDYRVGLTLLGSEVLCIRLCGQGQVITEPYVANPCESRGSNLQRQPGLEELDRLVRSDG
jgi:hypothetical protein